MAAGKMVTGPLSTVQARMRHRATRKQLQKRSDTTGAISGTTGEFASALIDFLHSSEFATLAMSIAAQHFAESRQKKQIGALEAAKASLRSSLTSLEGAQSVDVTDIVTHIWDLLNDSITRESQQAVASSALTAESRAAIVRMAANFARADIFRSEFLSDAKTISSYYAFEEEFNEQAKSLHATMRLPHAGTTRRVAYSRLFVEPSFTPFTNASGHPKGTSSDKATLADVIAGSHRAVILGDPGGGKSTLSLKLAYDIARSGFSAATATVPFLVVLRDYTKDFEAGKATMLQYLEGLCRSPYNLEPPAGFVDYALSSGRAFIIFDGLDELIDTSLRRKVVELVESFAYKYPMTPILVTTRKVGYEEAPLDDTLFAAVQLAQLDEPGVRSYAKKWFTLDNTLNKERRTELSRSFYQDSRFVADLTRNPLMLSLMCGIYASENYIPANRPEVYKKCAELLFDKWDKQRGIITPLPFDAHVKHAINALAFSIYSNPENQSGVKREKLIRFFKDFLLDRRFEDEDEAEDAATRFVDFCTGRAWVLSNVGSDSAQELYGFTHRTFLEYFAANQLVRLNPTPDRLFSQLSRKIAHAEWDVVSQLALQIIGNTAENGTDEFLGFVTTAVDDATLEEAANLVTFAARSLEFSVPSPGVIRKITQASVELALKAASLEHDDYFHLRGVRALLHANRENLSAISRNLRDEFRSERSEDVRRRELKLALAINTSFVQHAGFDMSYMDEKSVAFWQTFEEENVDLFESDLRLLATERAWAAAMAASAGFIPISEAIARFGPEILYQWRIGPLTLRAPMILRLGVTDHDEEVPRVDQAMADCLAELSEILPTLEGYWFTTPYNYEAITYPGYLGPWRRPLSQLDVEHRDAIALILAAWCELAGSDVEDNPAIVHEGPNHSLASLVRKWASARSDASLCQSGLRSVRACQLKPSTIARLTSWIEGQADFVSPVVKSALAKRAKRTTRG
ncbi:NACHT domain-containing protein [Streptomyces sp. NPDC006184]|uniref:NACHT domain-containing protein n=1 Tax=Streptomyces sp. NPDC006184 TaxID=3155455 RepID=UPI0033BDF5D2